MGGRGLRKKDLLEVITAEDRLSPTRGKILAKCKICGASFTHERSIFAHVNAVHPGVMMAGVDAISMHTATTIDDYFQKKERTERPSGSCMTKRNQAMVTAMSTLGIGLATVEKEEFKNLLSLFGVPAGEIPSLALLRRLTISYGEEIRQANLKKLKGRNVSIIVDGMTLGDRTFYCATYFCDRMLFFGGLFHIQIADADSLSHMLEEPLKEVAKSRGIPIAIVTDNAKNLVAATSPVAPAERNRTTIQQLTNQQLVHVRCSVHTTQLALSDLAKRNQPFRDFKRGIQELLLYLHEKKVKKVLRDLGVSCKVPKIQDIKWTSFYDAFVFMSNYQQQINQCLKANPGDRAPNVEEIPDIWMSYLTTLKPLGEHIMQIQKGTVYLWEFWRSHMQLIETWKNLENPFALELCELVEARFRETADGTLAELAHLLSMSNVQHYQEVFSDYYSWDTTSLERKLILAKKKEQLCAKLVDLAQYWGVCQASESIPALFDRFLGNLGQLLRPGESTEAFYRRLSTETLAREREGVVFQISWQGFAITALRVTQLPASEAVAERVFSQLQLLVPPCRFGANDDLVAAQTTIRMQNIFDKANSDCPVRME